MRHKSLLLMLSALFLIGGKAMAQIPAKGEYLNCYMKIAGQELYMSRGATNINGNTFTDGGTVDKHGQPITAQGEGTGEDSSDSSYGLMNELNRIRFWFDGGTSNALRMRTNGIVTTSTGYHKWRIQGTGTDTKQYYIRCLYRTDQVGYANVGWYVAVDANNALVLVEEATDAAVWEFVTGDAMTVHTVSLALDEADETVADLGVDATALAAYNTAVANVRTAVANATITGDGAKELKTISDAVDAAKATLAPYELNAGDDATKYIVNPDFEMGNLTGWTLVKGATGDVKNSNSHWVVTPYQHEFEITQTISRLPEGIYKVGYQAFTRKEDNTIEWNKIVNGTEIPINASVTANGQVQLASHIIDEYLTSKSSGYTEIETTFGNIYVADNRTSFQNAFDVQGLYKGFVYCIVGADNKLTIDFQHNESEGRSYGGCDNFTLTYIGTTATNEATDLIAQIPTGKMTAEVQTALDNAKAAVEADPTVENLNALAAAIHQAAVSTTAYNTFGTAYQQASEELSAEENAQLETLLSDLLAKYNAGKLTRSQAYEAINELKAAINKLQGIANTLEECEEVAAINLDVTLALVGSSRTMYYNDNTAKNNGKHNVVTKLDADQIASLLGTSTPTWYVMQTSGETPTYVKAAAGFSKSDLAGSEGGAWMTKDNTYGSWGTAAPLGFSYYGTDIEWYKYNASSFTEGEVNTITFWLANFNTSKKIKYTATITWVKSFLAEATLAVSDSKYATFIAPFDVTIPEGVTAYTVEGVEGTELTLKAVETTIAANTPVVLYSETPVSTTVKGLSTATEEAYTTGLLTGVYKDKDALVGTYVLQDHDGKVAFYYVGSTPVTVKAGHAYLTAPSSDVKAYGFDAIATAINNLNATKAAAEGTIYNVSGQQQRSLQRGINIVGGKKVVIK